MNDEDGFVAFYTASYRRIVGQVFAVVGDLSEAEDITQEAFIRAAARWPSVRDYEAPQAWVRRVALNLALSTMRRARRGARLMLLHGADHTVDEPSLDRLALVQALARLPLRYRSVLALHYMVDLSVPQIAEELHVPEATVRTRLVRGRRRLGELMDDAPYAQPSPSTDRG